jgi:hypothetical protein
MELNTETNHVIPDNGLADGGERYTDEECAVTNSPELIMFVPDKETNRAALALGVRYAHCLYAGTPEVAGCWDDITPEGLYVSSNERYDNGGINAFLRKKSDPKLPPVGFIRVR